MSERTTIPEFDGPDSSLVSSISLEELLCPPIPSERANWVDRLQKVIADKISSSVPQIEKELGLEQPSPALRYDLSEAVLLCVLVHLFPPERRSEIVKNLKAISKDALAAERNARRLMARLDENDEGIYPPIKHSFLAKLRQHMSDYASLCTLADAHATLKDPGGQTGLIAFRALVDRLVRAFESATGDRATVAFNAVTEIYEGDFLKFMHEVVSMMHSLFPKISYPSTKLAIDVFVFRRVTSFRRTSDKEAKKKRRHAHIADQS
jgi:hypothetical protein